MHHALGFGLLIFCISFAFGKRAAQICVGATLVTAALALLYIVFRVVSETL